MASSKKTHAYKSSDTNLRRNRFRRVVLETLERRELLAADSAGVVFAPGTPQDYVDTVIESYMKGTAGSGEDSGNFNLQGSRWTNPVGGPSPSMGDTAVVTWSIVPDGTVDGTDGSTTNLIAFMDSIYGGGAGPVEQRPWFNIFDRAYDRWSEISGLTFVYEPNDDGSAMGGTNRGVDGVRGDVRIGGRNIDGNFGVLAFNYFPNNGGNGGFDGDMIIDTNDVFYFDNADAPSGENRALSNVLMHEAGHGIGLGHVIPVNETKLMEPFVSTAYLGPQLDDLLGAVALYGDDFEPNDARGAANNLGSLGNGLTRVNGSALDADNDTDWFRFNVASSGLVSILLEPIGQTYEVGPQGGSTVTVDTTSYQDLSFNLVDSSGNVLATASSMGLSENENLIDFSLPAGGDYFVQVEGVGNNPQLYRLSLSLRGVTDPNQEAVPPRLLAVAPNVGEIFSFNRTNELALSPNELLFRFDGAQFLDASSFDGIRITRSGYDGVFGDGNDIVVDPGFIGFGESDRIIVARFASALPDDLYRVEVFGVDIASEGISAVRNLNGDALLPRLAGTDRDTIFFNLELGSEIVAIVPQPTSRIGSTIIQARDQIEVYFNEGDRLHPTDVVTGAVSPNPTVVDPSFYQLFADRGTITNTDDAVHVPTRIEYFADRNMALLTFDSDIDQLEPGETEFRLRIGTNESQPSAPVTIAQAADPGSTFSSAATGSANLGVFNSLTSLIVSEQIVNSSAFPLDFPGAPDTPGSREVLTDPTGGESYLLADAADRDVNLTRILYTFNRTESFGTNSQGNPLFSSITREQENRAREVFEFYGSMLGIDFVETSETSIPGEQVFWIITGELDGPGGALAVAGGGQVIMDAAVPWDDRFGPSDDPNPATESWFAVAMHEVGHLLGLAHATDLPPGTIMGGFYSDGVLGGETALQFGNDTEPIFPGSHDVVHGRYLHRPDSRDIDIYRFEVAPGSSGLFTAEIVAERQSDSSLLDSVLTLYRENSDGSREVIAVNDDYFSQDSFLSLDLAPGIYYLGVSASGNTDYDPTIIDSGLNGTSEGAYELRTTFRPLVASSIVDEDGTALDGDSDGVAGGVFNFWFNAASLANTIFVDKAATTIGANGSITNPFNTISAAFAASAPGDIIRILPNGGVDGDIATQDDNFAYEIGRGGLGNAVLQDGQFMNLPKGVTVMVDAGALFKMGGSVIGVGSSTSTGDQSRAALQILGTPEQQVFFTSYTDQNLGVDTNPLNTVARPGDWGGIIFRNALDRAEGRFDQELDGRFLNYVAHANMQFGGGQVSIDGQPSVVTPLHMVTARPTLIHNQITQSASAAVSADPNSFQESTFLIPRFQSDVRFTPDYSRIGPEIHDNTLFSNSLNGLFVRVETLPGQSTAAQTVAGRWNDTDIVHFIADTLTVAGTAGGPFLETRAPELATIQIAPATVSGGQLVSGSTYRYRMTFIDANENEGVPSAPTLPITLGGANNTIRLSNLTPATAGFVGRRLYRSDNGGPFQLVAQLDRNSTVHVDGSLLGATVLDTTRTSINRAQLDASLVIDPGMVVKLQGGRIVAGISAQVVAEGRDGLPIVFTSRQDDRFGAGSTFDSNNDGSASSPEPGDWGGIFFRPLSSGSLDFSLVTHAGGITSVAGTFASFNAVEVHQADVRISNSTIENNASGLGGPIGSNGEGTNREGFTFNEAAAIFVRGAQPIIINNVIRDNSGAAISIDPHSTNGESVKDHGRITGLANRLGNIIENKGPLIRGNALGNNDVNALVLRGVTLNNDSVWDDTDIVHAVFDEIVVPDFHVFGGLRLQSNPDESLVVKFGPGAGLTSNGRPLDIQDRIGGTLQVLGSPGFPVILTSIADDSVGAGFDPFGGSQTDTNNDGSGSLPAAGDWRSLKIDEFSNDRNVAVAIELEPAQSTGAGVNGIPGSAQNLGLLANSEKSSDDNLRLGFVVSGTINNVDDVDVYSFTAQAGTQVWLDIDRTTISLDAVVELVDADGNILAQSDNSFDESQGLLPLVNNLPSANHVNSLQDDLFGPRNGGASGPALSTLSNTFSDFYSTNPLDPGLRVVLPGSAGSFNPYFVRVRSSNIDSRDAGSNRADLQDPSKLADGLTQGQYQLQIRLRATDEVAGSSIAYADVRYATNGIEVLGQPGHSPLAGEAVEQASNNDTLANALDLGNLLNTDRGALAVAGSLASPTDVDWYRFAINQDSIQSDGLVQHLSTIIDVDYADGFSRANTSLWLFYDDQNGLGSGAGIRLVSVGFDSNIADDQGAPLNGSDTDDLSRGSAGLLDAFLGAMALPSGEYFLAITSNQQIPSYLAQYFTPDAGGNQFVRLEPNNGVTRIIEDRFGATSGVATQTVGFAGTQNQVPFTLADVPLFFSRSAPAVDQSWLTHNSAMTGDQISLISQFGNVEDIAIRGDGILHGSRVVQVGVVNDANSGGISEIDTAGNGATVASTANSGIQTFELDLANNPPTVAQALTPGTGGARQGVGMQFLGLTYPQLGSAQQFLYAVGSRGYGQTQFRTFTGFTDARNYIYKLDPATLQATSAPQADRQDDARIFGAGTQIVERGYVDTSEELNPNVAYQTVGMADATPIGLPAVLSGDQIAINTPNGLFVFEWNAATPSATLVADTSPQTAAFQFGLQPPTNFFADGMTFQLTGTSTADFEIDTGRILVNDFNTIADPTVIDGSIFEIRDIDGDSVFFEFDGNTNLIDPTRVPIVFDPAAVTQDVISQAVINAINNTAQALVPTFTAQAFILPGTNRISLTDDSRVIIPAFDPVAVAANPPSPLTLTQITVGFPTLAAGETLDGSTVTITDQDGDTLTFEYDLDSSVAAGNVPVTYTTTSDQRFLTQALNAAINNVPAGILATLAGTWDVVSIFNNTPVLDLLGDALVTLSTSTATIINPLSLTPEYGVVTAGAIPVAIEEFFPNLDDINFLPAPSTQGAMDELVATINAAGIGITASSINTRLILDGLVDGDFAGLPTVAFNQSSGAANTVPFDFFDDAATLNGNLLAAIQTVEPLAQLVDGGSRVWLPARSSFIQTLSDDRLDAPERNAEFSNPEYGFLTGLAFSGATMFAVSDNGDLFRVGGDNFNPNSTQNNGDFIETIYNTNTGNRVEFVSLTSGPRNAEGTTQFGINPLDRGLDNILFGLDSAGVLYAFDTAGRPANVFEDGAWFIQTDVAAPSGLAFSNLDVNLWHETGARGTRADDPGHGVNITFDGQRRTQGNGGNSLYFGFTDPTAPLRQVGDWTGINNPGAAQPGYDATRLNTYDFPGGTKGSIVSNTLNLSNYGPADKPTLYFNYYLATENANANNPADNNFMKDAFRVFVAGNDGVWRLVGTNNSDFDPDRGVGLPDELDYLLTNDPIFGTSKVSELFDVNDTIRGVTVPDAWRQARVDLSAFAGDETVRIRFDFSTAGSFDASGTGAIELVAVAGDQLASGDTFQISGRTFEFDLGLVLQVPSGAALTSGEQFEVDGVIYTFSDTSNAGDDVLFSATDTPETIAQNIVAKLLPRGLNATLDPVNRGRISVLDAVNTAPAIDASLINKGFLQSLPGVAPGNIPVLINNTFTTIQVRDAMRVAMAATFNVPGQENNIDTIRVNASSIFLWNKTVDDPGKLGLNTTLQADEFGERVSGPTNIVGQGAQRGQNNRFEGVYVDDIIVGFAERGELVTYENNDTPTILTFEENPNHEPGPGLFQEIETGTYQIEIRRGPSFGAGGQNFPSLGIFRQFDTNDRFGQFVSLVAPSGYQVADGQTFTLSDGVDTLTFEFDDSTIVSGPFVGVAQGNIEIPFTASDDAAQLARTIRNAINSAESQATLGVVAALSNGAVDDGTGNDAVLGKQTESRVINLHGKVSVSNAGSSLFFGTGSETITNATDPGFVLHGLDRFPLNESGDSNLFRDQGQILIHSNVIRDASNFGIVVDAGARLNPGLVPLAGALPHPGSVRNLFQFNSEGLVPGPVLINNLIYANAVGGILFSGDSRNVNSPQAPVPFGRIVNNTIVGINGSGIGISVTENASPTLLNNVVASLATGISIDGTSTTTVVGSTAYQGNGQNSNRGLGTNPIVLSATEPLFVNASNRNYYPAEGSRIIDSSIDSLNDRQAMTSVRSPLGIAVSPILAPNTDITGQLRVDDPDISNPNGTGGNPFKDRGAYDRADFFGPVAVLQQPVDNDPDILDIDRTNTIIRIAEGSLSFFSILLVEPEGTGPDARTVTQNTVTLTQNGRLLQPGIDYVFGYNAGSRLIRLTPLSGVWRADSVYEITLNNQDAIRATVPVGPAEGDTFTVVAGGNTLTFEFDSDGTVADGSIPVDFAAGQSDYEIATRMVYAINNAGAGLFAYHLGSSVVNIHGATSVGNLASQFVGAITDVAANPLRPNRINSLTQFTIIMPEVQLDFGDAPGANQRTVTTDSRGFRTLDASRHAILPVDAPPLFLGTYADSETDGQPSPSGQRDDSASARVTTSIPNVRIRLGGGAIVKVEDATAAIDGMRFTITDPTQQTVTFEFDTDPNPGTVGPGGVARIAVNVGDSANVVANKIRTAVDRAVLNGKIEGLTSFVTGNLLDLGGSSQYTFDFTAARGALARIPQSDFTVDLPANVANYSDGDTITIQGTDGRTIVFELDDLSSSSASVIATGRIAVPVDLTTATADDVAAAWALAMNNAITSRQLSLAPVALQGTRLVMSGDDEDGVTFGGLFNAGSRAVPVTVNATGNGLLTVWFDWNGDGDFSDAGERIASATNLPISSGATTLMIDTPAAAQVAAEAFLAANPGQRFYVASRFRLSTNGTPLLGAAGIGGEVEDYMVEIVVGTPPVAVNDHFVAIEDTTLVVPAFGVLANDTDADNSLGELTIVDEDPTTPEIDLVRNVERGTLVVNRNGSFTYTPAPDFYGRATFVYNISDPRLLGEQPATVTIDVQPVNDAPTGVDDELSISEDEVIIRPYATFTDNDFKGVEGTPSQINELAQEITILSFSFLPNSGSTGGTVVLNGSELQYTPEPNYNSLINGPVLIELVVQDNGQSYNETTGMLEDDFKTSTSTLTINIAPRNDVPVFTIPAQVTVKEDAGPQRLDPFATGIAPGPSNASDESTQTLTFVVNALDPSVFASAPSIDANGVLTYELLPDLNTRSPFPSEILVEVFAVDGGPSNTVIENMFDPASLGTDSYDGVLLTVADVAGNTVIFELDDANFPGVGSTGGFGHVAVSFDPAVDTPQTISQKLVDAINNPPATSINPAGGDWQASAFVDGLTQQIGLINDSNISTSSANSGLASPFDIRSSNTSETVTFTISPIAINDAPEFTIPATVALNEDAGPQSIANFLTDARPGPSTALDELASQSLTLQVAAVDPSAFTATGQPRIVFDAATGTGVLTFELAPDVNNSTGHNLGVRVTMTDNGGTATSDDINSTVKTFTLDVTPVNDAPSFTISQTLVTVFEDNESVTGNSPTVIPGFAGNVTVGPSTAIDETTITATRQTATFVSVSVSNLSLFAEQPRILANGDLTFRTAPNRNGRAFVVVNLLDSGAGPATGNGDQNQSQNVTFTISVTPVNDAPQFTLPAQIVVAEDAGLVSRSAFVTNIGAGPQSATDEEGQLIRFEVEAVVPANFLVQPAIAEDGTLTFQTAANVNSLNADLRVRVRLVDNGLGAPAPNQNTSTERVFTIVADPVNDSPIAGNDIFNSIEDVLRTIPASSILANDVAGPTPDERGVEMRITQVETTSAQGGTVTPIFGDATDPTRITSIEYLPAANFSGTDTFLYVVTDFGSPQQSGTGTVTINVGSQNDAPSFTAGGNVVVSEDHGVYTEANWATDISAGPGESQTVTFVVENNNSLLFAVQPSVNSDGLLEFETATDANGSAVVIIYAQDDGVGTAPQSNRSATQSFTITINAVNDAPVFTAGGNVIVDEDSGAYSEPWATNIAAAAGILASPATALDEAGQTLSFDISVDRPELFSELPTMSSDGVLSFTPTASAFGATVATVSLSDQLNGVSTTRTFTITMTQVNDAPVAVNDNYVGSENQVLSIESAGLLENDTDADLPSDTITAVAESIQSAFGANVTINSDGSFTYDPTSVSAIQQLTTGQSVVDSFLYQARDRDGLTSNSGTVFITVQGVDDAPIAADDNFGIGVSQTRRFSVLANDRDIDSLIDVSSISITQFPVFGTVTVDATGVVEYTAGNGFTGTDTFAYTVSDAAGNVSNEAVVTVNINSAPTAGDDSAFTFKGEIVDINVLSNDADLDGSLDATSVEVVVAPNDGSAEVLPNGSIRFTPNPDFAGEATLSYVVSDNLGTTSNVATVTIRVQNSRWQNPQGSLDVNADGFITPIDVLLIINYLNGDGDTFLPNTGIDPEPFLDPTGDENVTPLDALIVINYLNDQSQGGGGEGESFAAPLDVLMLTPSEFEQAVQSRVQRSHLDQEFSMLAEGESDSGDALAPGNVASLLITGERELPSSLPGRHEESIDLDALDDFFGNLGDTL